MSLYPFADTMTETVCDRLVRAARIRQPLRRLAWRNAVQDAINNFRPATTAKPEDVSCVVSTSGAASCKGLQGGANSASASADSAVGARRLTPG